MSDIWTILIPQSSPDPRCASEAHYALLWAAGQGERRGELVLSLLLFPFLFLLSLPLLLDNSVELFLVRDHGTVGDVGTVGDLELQLAVLARRALNGDIVAYHDVVTDPDPEDDRVVAHGEVVADLYWPVDHRIVPDRKVVPNLDVRVLQAWKVTRSSISASSPMV